MTGPSSEASGPEHRAPDPDALGGDLFGPPQDDLDVFEFVRHDPPGLDDGPDRPAAEPPARRAGVLGRMIPGRRRARRRSAAAAVHGSHALPGARPAARTRRPAGIALLTVVGLGFLAAVVLVLRGLLGGADYDAVSGEEVMFTVRPGESISSVAERLDKAGIVASDARLRRAAEDSDGPAIGPGEYVLRERMPAAEALGVLQGRTVGAVHYVLVGRGQRLTEVLDALVESTGLSRADLDAAAAEPGRYGVPAPSPSLEGWLDPGEYRIPVDSSAEDVLRTLVAPRLEFLKEHGVTDGARSLRVVTIASLLEAEALPRDYARVAGVIENRLAPGNTETRGLLQIDSTVTYGLGVRSLQFSATQRDDASNAYNTYVHPGLPPGPIGMPSDAAVTAALDPEPSDDYYWVTTDIATGHTEFSRTYEEHRAHQREFQKYCAANPENC